MKFEHLKIQFFVFFKKTKRSFTTFDVGRSMFDVDVFPDVVPKESATAGRALRYEEGPSKGPALPTVADLYQME